NQKIPKLMGVAVYDKLDLAALKYLEGNVAEAEKRYQEIITAGADRNAITYARVALASIASAQGRYEEAEKNFSAADKIFVGAGDRLAVNAKDLNLSIALKRAKVSAKLKNYAAVKATIDSMDEALKESSRVAQARFLAGAAPILES